jgi:hypothetical protein
MELAVHRAVRLEREALVRQRLAPRRACRADGGLGQRPVDDVALRVAAAELVRDEADRVQRLDGLPVVAAPKAVKPATSGCPTVRIQRAVSVEPRRGGSCAASPASIDGVVCARRRGTPSPRAGR